MKKVSKKMSKINSEYSKLRREFLLEHPVCHASIDRCSVKATEVHHKRGRGKYHLDISTWLPVCRNCHTYIELNPEDAIELGFSEKRN
jgi:hypothetical protein